MRPDVITKLRQLRRREFTAGLCALVGRGIRVTPARAADAALHVLKPDGLDRIRMDFNASMTKVRLLAVLSPT